MCIPRFSSSWWVWLGSWDPGTLGDSCCGTCRTLAAAAAGREVEKVTRGYLYIELGSSNIFIPNKQFCSLQISNKGFNP